MRTASPSPDDIGALKAEIVFFEPRFRDEIVYLSGDTVTYDEVAGLLERVLGRPFKRIVPRRCGAETGIEKRYICLVKSRRKIPTSLSVPLNISLKFDLPC